MTQYVRTLTRSSLLRTVFFDHASIAKGLGLPIKLYFYILTLPIFLIHSPIFPSPNPARIPPRPSCARTKSRGRANPVPREYCFALPSPFLEFFVWFFGEKSSDFVI